MKSKGFLNILGKNGWSTLTSNPKHKSTVLYFVLKGLDNSRQVKNLKKTTKLLSLKDMSRQSLHLLLSSVDSCTKRCELNL